MVPLGAGFTFQISVHCPIVAALFATEMGMANQRFEMYHYRQVLVRMRQGESDRQIAATGLMGRQNTACDHRPGVRSGRSGTSGFRPRARDR